MLAIIALRCRVDGYYDLEFMETPGWLTGDERKLLPKESKTMILTLTDTAASEVKKFLEAENVGNDGGLRVRVVPGGCSGFQYAMNIEEAPQANDEVVESSGLRVFVDMFSAQYLENVQIDYVNSVMGSGFTFNNPNATGGCGCGSSFTA
jgi:iron-sulfur cluster assembly protein